MAPLAQEVMPAKQVPGFPVHDCPAVQAMHAPLPSQTEPVPQDVPAPLLPKSRQTGAPVRQLVMPVLHAVGLVAQFAFAVQAMQPPGVPLQTRLVPQVVPAGSLASSTQVWAPVAHDVVPVLQVPVLVEQLCAAAHATHAPALLQTVPTPQLAPAARFAPSMQVVAAPLQLVVPCLQAVGLPVQLWLATHAPQKPLPSQIWPPVQAVVDDFGVPSMHADAPVTQEVTPLRQIDGLVVQDVPAVHETQVPLPLQTRLVPQVVPAAVEPESRQRGAPVVQSMTPLLQGAPGLVVHALPDSHVTHCPFPLHTMFEPHAIPAPTLSPSRQPDADPHATTPSLHTPPGFVVQTVPAAQAVQTPALQALSMPQNSPSVALASSRHWGAPVLHAIAPFLQGLPGFVEQVAPVAHGMQVAAALHT